MSPDRAMGNLTLKRGRDNIVVALGFKPRTALAKELEEKGLPFRLVGDCRSPAKLMGAIHDGALAAWEI